MYDKNAICRELFDCGYDDVSPRKQHIVDRRFTDLTNPNKNSMAMAKPNIKYGFHVDIHCHTQEALDAITSPEALRFQIGHMLDSWAGNSSKRIQEEIDYTLEVNRTYELHGSPTERDEH